jgi:hypothetical protein
MSWSDHFENAIELPSGGCLETLRDAAEFIQSLPKAEQQRKEWQLATRILIGAAEGRDFLMHAHIAMLRALKHQQQAAKPRGKRDQ